MTATIKHLRPYGESDGLSSPSVAWKPTVGLSSKRIALLLESTYGNRKRLGEPALASLLGACLFQRSGLHRRDPRPEGRLPAANLGDNLSAVNNLQLGPVGGRMRFRFGCEPRKQAPVLLPSRLRTRTLLSGSPPLSGERPSPPQHQARLYSPRTPFAKRARRILRLALRLPYCRLRPSARVRQQTQPRETPSTRGSALRVAQKERGAKVRQRLDQNPSPG